MTHAAALAAKGTILAAKTHAAALAANGPAIAAGGGTILNTGGVTTILVAVFSIAVLTLAIRATMHAHRGAFGAVITMVGILALAAMFYNLASSNQVGKLGGDLVHQFLNI